VHKRPAHNADTTFPSPFTPLFPPAPARSYYTREIQRLYRGHLARRRVRALVDARYAALLSAPRHYAATTLQRHFRGFYSRKYIKDFYARKAYVLAVTAKGEQLRAEMDAALAEQVARHLSQEEAKARAAFDAATQNLHHLVSTRAQPGVYNPPYAARMEDVPSAFGVPLETHLRVGTLRFLRTNGLYTTAPSRAFLPNASAAAAVATSAAAAAAGTAPLAPGATAFTSLGERNARLVPSYVQADKRTLQATAPFDAPLLAAREEARRTKLLNLDQRPFVAGAKGHVFEGPKPVGVMAATPYIEPWLVGRSTRETEPMEGRQLRVSDRPYVPASSRASRLFEDTERRTAAFAAAALAGTAGGAAAGGGSGGGAGATAGPGGAMATTAAFLAGPESAPTHASRTQTLRIGDQTLRRQQQQQQGVSLASTAAGRTLGGGGGGGSPLQEEAVAAAASATSAAADAALLDPTLSAYAAGSAAAAVRKARQAQVGVFVETSVVSKVSSSASRGGGGVGNETSRSNNNTSSGSVSPPLVGGGGAGGDYDAEKASVGVALTAAAPVGTRRSIPPTTGGRTGAPRTGRPLMKPLPTAKGGGDGTVPLRGGGLPA
jgi:hypothetical protein